jgi:hypothetical protein
MRSGDPRIAAFVMNVDKCVAKVALDGSAQPWTVTDGLVLSLAYATVEMAE